MDMSISGSIWIRRQQCPCGDWKCYINYEGVDQPSMNPQAGKDETMSTSATEAIFPPYVGQIFRTDDDAFDYYSKFARKNGFSIRKARSTGSQNLGVYRRDFVCYRSGFNQPRKKADVEHPRDRKSVRCGCDAKLYLTKEIVDGLVQWFVSQFSNVHNHELLKDDEVRLLPAYRKIKEADQERILLLAKAGFPVNRIIKLLELEKGVQTGQLPFIEKDVRNFVRNCKKISQENDTELNERRVHDIIELLEACKDIAENDLDFVYDYITDANGKVENIAWSFGNCTCAFARFGDVVTFDTSYRSITYGFLLGLWFGINNNGDVIFFGCVLLQEENVNSFTWAFQTFFRFMRGQLPQTIITDIDPRLREPIERELPNTKHLISIWHILSKLPSWFSSIIGGQIGGLKAEFEILCHSENWDDFERQWDAMVTRFGLVSDKHIELLFSYRTMWPSSLIKDCFVGHAMTLKYLTSLRTVMKNLLSSQTCMRQFFDKVVAASKAGNRAVASERYMIIQTCLPMEEHARGILSPYAFSTLQREMALSMQYTISEMTNGSYLVQHHKKLDRERFVIWTDRDEQICCSCKEFEHSKLLCRHSLRVLLARNCFQLPEKYLPQRWRRSNISNDDGGDADITDERVQSFRSLASDLLTESLVSTGRFTYAEAELRGLVVRVKNMPESDALLPTRTQCIQQELNRRANSQ
ncbi:hypothetical protein MLD38_021277 [Melastoma candidum]|uniref:Uncharacterized protein n=1 Tax=Melastoma candidum TaxID=119954 RepID=A0ACB9QFU8_9MYRT|nr:hypothetical protein MLD38_021277 [Melastoma candidum]